MGNQQNKYESSITNSKGSTAFFKSNFIECNTESTPMLGEYTVYEPLNGQYEGLVLAKETKVDNQQEFSNLKNLLNRRSKIKTDFLADLVTYYEKVETEWCSKYYRIWVVYEYSPLTLEKELWDRYKIKNVGQGKVSLDRFLPFLSNFSLSPYFLDY